MSICLKAGKIHGSGSGSHAYPFTCFSFLPVRPMDPQDHASIKHGHGDDGENQE